MSKYDYSILLSSGQTDNNDSIILKDCSWKKVESLIFLYVKNDPLLNFALNANIPAVVVGTPDKVKSI